jgi:hypothetical protein
MMENEKLNDDELVKDIISRYGEVIDLRKTPHLILEIFRTHGGRMDIPDGGVSVAGVGTPPGPSKMKQASSLGSVVDNVEIMKEILKLSKKVNQLTEHVQKIKTQ